MKTIKNLVFILCAPVVCCTMTACNSLQSQMNSYDNDIRSNMGGGKWNAAGRVIDDAKFECGLEEQDDVTAWRNRERLQMKATFAKSLVPKIAEANAYYSKNAFAEGDNVRQSLKDRYIGGKIDSESSQLLPQWFSKDKGGEGGIPESLVPCVNLAWVQMLSDRNIARMTSSFSDYIKRIDEIDVNGGKKSVKEFDAIADGFKKVEKWKDKIDLFMQMLADEETRRWSPIDRSTYAGSIKKMESVRNEVIRKYRTKRWNTRVIDRKKDYDEVAKLSAAKKYHAAMQILSSHDLLEQPIGLEGVIEFDDQAERAKVASEGLGIAVVKDLIDTNLSGVQYSRRTKKGVFSMLVIGRSPIDDKENKRKLREQGRVAQMQAKSEFVSFMKTSVSSNTEWNLSLENEDTRESFSKQTKEMAQADVSNLTVLATGIHGDEVVIVLGWRDPEAGTITPAPMHRVEGRESFTISPSVGAYL